VSALSNLNFRDLGGVAVRGGTLRRGVLYRSEGPRSFDARHRAELVALGFRVVCDLRSDHEQQRAPNDWVQDARLLSFDIVADLRARNDDAWNLMRAAPTVDGARATMTNVYRAIPSALIPHLPRLVEAVTARETPILVHCTAGKDRTGVVVALLLRLLGASEADIQRDYLLSESYSRRAVNADLMRERFRKALGSPPDEQTLMAVIGVDSAYLDAAMQTVTAQWGSVDAYFTAAGIDAAQVAELLAVLVEPAVA
jgi:protein-tyrosine phosphatase